MDFSLGKCKQAHGVVASSFLFDFFFLVVMYGVPNLYDNIDQSATIVF